MTTIKADAYIDAVTCFFDQLVPVATDDQLFASGYLRGHFDLAVGSLEVEGKPFNITDIIQQVTDSLQQAITSGELDAKDQQLVNDIWLQIQALGS